MSPERFVAALAAAALLTAGAKATRTSMLRRGTPIDVLALFFVPWAIVLLAFAIPLIDYSTTPVSAWLLLYGSLGTTALGCLAAQRVVRGRGSPIGAAAAATALRSTIDARRLRALWLVCALLGLVGFGLFLDAVDEILDWSAVITDPENVRGVRADSPEFDRAYGVGKVLIYFNQMAFILWTIGLRSGAFSARWTWIRLAGWASILPFLFTVDRSVLFSLLLWAALVHALWPMAVSWRRFFAVVCLGTVTAAICFTAIGNRYGGSLGDHPEITPHLTTRAVDPVVIPYLYLTANIPTFGQLVTDELAPVTYGQMTTLPLVKLGHAAGIPGTSPIGTGVFYPIPFESFSNYGWLGTFWLDFRAAGVLLLAAGVGFAATFAHARFVRAPSIALLWITSLFFYVILFSPFANALTATLTWQHFLLTPIVALVLDRRFAMHAVAMAREVPRRRVLTGLAIAVLAAMASVSVVSTRTGDASSRANVAAELDLAARKAHDVYSKYDRYPGPKSLASQLQVNRPEVDFRPLSVYTEPVPPSPAVAVYTQPGDLFLRARSTDGRVFEIHRSETLGGVTFGPGTRD